jgi:GAF domain-containing protein
MSQPYPTPHNERRRLEALAHYKILDTEAEQSFDDLTRVASIMCQTPIALMALVDERRQWFKARLGLAMTETPREVAFCAYTICDSGTMIVEDATKDDRFCGNPLVTEDPNIRFYAGVPLIDKNKMALGSLCVIDRVPRVLTAEQVTVLEALGRQITKHIELRAVAAELAGALNDLDRLRKLLPICAHCKKIRDDQGYWKSVDEYFADTAGMDFSHGICAECLEIHHPVSQSGQMVKPPPVAG